MAQLVGDDEDLGGAAVVPFNAKSVLLGFAGKIDAAAGGIEAVTGEVDRVIRKGADVKVVVVPDGAVAPCVEITSIQQLRRLHAIDATRVHLLMKWVVSWSILRPFGPRRATAMLFGRDTVASRWRRVDGVCERRRALHAIAAARASVLDAFRDCRYAQGCGRSGSPG